MELIILLLLYQLYTVHTFCFTGEILVQIKWDKCGKNSKSILAMFPKRPQSNFLDLLCLIIIHHYAKSKPTFCSQLGQISSNLLYWLGGGLSRCTVCKVVPIRSCFTSNFRGVGGALNHFHRPVHLGSAHFFLWTFNLPQSPGPYRSLFRSAVLRWQLGPVTKKT